jgi:putative oxidoreductase
MHFGPIRLPFQSGPLPSGAALLAIRVVMGPMLAYHGYKKVDGGVEKFVATVDRLGFPLPELLARATIVIELAGGVCLTLGLLTRLWAALSTLQFLLIVAKVKWAIGVFGQPGRSGFELDLLYAVTAAALLLAGPGLLALDHFLGLEADPGADPGPLKAQLRTGGRAAG